MKRVEPGAGEFKEGDHDIGLDGWREAMLKAATIVTRYPKFVPLFIRAENEYAARLVEQSALARARKLAESGRVDDEFYLNRQWK